jgi:hypothetical protein
MVALRQKSEAVPAVYTTGNGMADINARLEAQFQAQTAEVLAVRGTDWPHLGSRFDADVRELKQATVARCYTCHEITIWLGDKLLWPSAGTASPPNPDMPGDIRRDYDEASTILDLSPRGAAALLRLAVQKLCVHLGEKGKNINEDIAALVAKGLDPRVQQALDVVRVIGNEAVHPGAMDLRDDRATAEHLFGLVNLIVERMISYPKHMDALYASLPASKLEEIERRNAKATQAK